MIRPIAIKDRSLYGLLVSLVTRSTWSHVGILAGSQIYEMTSEGILGTPKEAYPWEYEELDFALRPQALETVSKWYSEGVRYDWLECVTFLTRPYGLLLGTAGRLNCVEFVLELCHRHSRMPYLLLTKDRDGTHTPGQLVELFGVRKGDS